MAGGDGGTCGGAKAVRANANSRGAHAKAAKSQRFDRFAMVAGDVEEEILADESGVSVDFPAMAYIMEEEAARLDVELVKDAVITDTQSILLAALQPVMQVGTQSIAYFVHLAPDGVLDSRWQLIVGLAESMRSDLEGCAHFDLRLACAVLAAGNFSVGTFKCGLSLIAESKLVLAKILQPFPEFRQILRRQLWDGGLNFLHRAHDPKLPLFRGL